MVKTIEFGSANAARELRNDDRFKQFLAESDDGRERTLRLKEGAPDMVVQDARGEAADSKKISADSYGQVELSSNERDRIDFSKGRANVMHARSVKGIAAGKGVDDWTSFYDPQLTVDEHKRLMERAKRDERGSRDEGNVEQRQTRKMAQAHQQVQEGRLGHAKDAAFQGDLEAQGFVQESGAGFDIGFSRSDDGRLRGSGEDFDRLQDRHEDRPQRAQTLDEKRSATPTRDPFEWVNAPGRYDYPGVDTVQPNELHGDRSAQARAIDERSAAPFAESKEQWALSPGLYDWEGVDDADPERLHASRSERARTIDERELAMFADTKQQWAMNPHRYDWPGVDVPDDYGPTMDEPIPQGAFNGLTNRDRGPGVSTDVPDSTFDQLGGTGLAPEDFENAEWRESMDPGGISFGLAGGEEADKAFAQAEQERAAGFFEPGAVLDESMGGFDEAAEEFVDDRDRQGSLTAFGMETDGTTYRESRQAVEQASEFGVDDRSDPSRGVDETGGFAGGGLQEGLGGYGEDDDENQSLFGF